MNGTSLFFKTGKTEIQEFDVQLNRPEIKRIFNFPELSEIFYFALDIPGTDLVAISPGGFLKFDRSSAMEKIFEDSKKLYFFYKKRKKCFQYLGYLKPVIFW